MSRLYDSDFHAWTAEQAALLRGGHLAEADVAHIVEEIESMGRTERRELVNRLTVLLLHLLKWRYQPSRRGNSWRLSAKEQRLRLAAHLEDNPSLRSVLDASVVRAYRLAVIEVERETGLSDATFPGVCPFTVAQMMDEAFWPEG